MRWAFRAAASTSAGSPPRRTRKTAPAPQTTEGLSYVVSADDSEKMLLREMVSELGADVIGEFLWNKYHRWPAYSKFFDNLGPLPHHIHQRDEHAALTGQAGKPEMYFFPAQVNNYRGERAETYFGLNPGTTKEELKQSLMNFTKGDNKILELSRAYKQEVDTGYDVPAGVLHAPVRSAPMSRSSRPTCSQCTSPSCGATTARRRSFCGRIRRRTSSATSIISVDVVDWEKNVDPEFHKHRISWLRSLSCPDGGNAGRKAISRSGSATSAARLRLSV